MDPYTLTTAAEAVRKSKSTILRAIQGGRLSATRTDGGGWLIDASELFRVYPTLAARVALLRDGALPARNATGSLREFQLRLEAAEARTADKEAQLADAKEQIGDLRRRLDSESEERRRLTMLLADQRPAPAPTAPAPSRRRWWWRTARV